MNSFRASGSEVISLWTSASGFHQPPVLCALRIPTVFVVAFSVHFSTIKMIRQSPFFMRYGIFKTVVGKSTVKNEFRMRSMKDYFDRDIDYFRISITDRCNLRCRYCMPQGCEKVPMSQILTFEEIERICRAAARIGIRKLKITGGEPLVRLGCPDLIKTLKSIDGIEQVTMTTNGQDLRCYLDALINAGIDGINISLDSLDPHRYADITGGGNLLKTLQAIDLSVAAGIRTKVNCLLQKDFNEDEIFDLAAFAFQKGIYIRFIELMPIGIADPSKGISNEQVLHSLTVQWPDLERDYRVHGNGPAIYYKREGVAGGIGFISAIHDAFCSGCNRIRLTSQGQLKPCLCYDDGVDLKPYLRQSDQDLEVALKEAIRRKPGGHCFTAKRFGSEEHRLMSQIGG